jgi:hypothetical protein
MFTYTYERQDIIKIALKRLPGGRRVPKNEMSLRSLIFKNDARSLARQVTWWHSFKNY